MAWWAWLIIALVGVLVYVVVGAFIYGRMERRLDPKDVGTMNDWSAPFASFWPVWLIVAPIVAFAKWVINLAISLGDRSAV